MFRYSSLVCSRLSVSGDDVRRAEGKKSRTMPLSLHNPSTFSSAQPCFFRVVHFD